MLNIDQKEALQEIANIGMGQAGEMIARALNEFIILSIPRILILKPNLVAPALTRMVGPKHVSAVRQAFHGALRGEAIVLYGEKNCHELAGMMGYETGANHASELEILLDISNILVGACLGGIAGQLKLDIGFSSPSLLADQVPICDILDIENVSWQNALLIEVNFQLEKHNFSCHLTTFMPEQEIAVLAGAIDRFLETLFS